MPKQKNKRGRPPGAKTKSETPGRKRAREYFDLIFDSGLRSTAAAVAAAEKFSTEPHQIFKDKKRHEPFLAKEEHAKAEKARQECEAIKAVLDMGPHELRDEALVYHIFAETLKGNTL